MPVIPEVKMKVPIVSRWVSVVLLPVAIGCSSQPSKPDQTGLAPCPDSPNCVSSLATKEGQRVAPLPYEGDGPAAMQKLLALVKTMPRSRVVDVQPQMIQVEFHTPIFKFKDDVTFWLDEPNKVIHLRSAARSGYYDFGVNRKRAQAIARLWHNQEQGASREQ